MEFLVRVANNSHINKMDASNLGTMLGPNLLRSDETTMHQLLQEAVKVAVVVQTLITEFPKIFGREAPSIVFEL